MKIQSLRDLFQIELWYAYDCEKKLVDKGLPTMIESCTSPELRSALQQHLAETQRHVSRLERIFQSTAIEPDTKGNDVLKSIMSAAKDSASHIEASPLRDAALIANGNEVEHYEIALYGTLVAFARQLGLASAVGPLEETLNEEKAADAKLTQLAQMVINTDASQTRAASA